MSMQSPLQDAQVQLALPDNGTGHFAPSTSNRMPLPTVLEILTEIFDADWARNVHLCSVAGDPNDGGNWSGYRLHDRFGDGTRVDLPADQNNFFAIGMQSRVTTGRANSNVIVDYLVVLDDVGAKVDQAKVEALRMWGIEPVMVVETSPGNFQYFYRLDEPVERTNPDKQERRALIDLVREGLRSGEWGDRAVQDLARYMRLPFGKNAKGKYRQADGSFPDVKLAEWNPGTRVDLETLAMFFVGADWKDKLASFKPGQRPASALPAGSADKHASMDDVYVQLAAFLGMDPYQQREGVVAALCPNRHNHSSTDPTGFAFINPYRGYCNHDHCQGITSEGFMALMADQYADAIQTDLRSGKLRDDGMCLRNAVGQVVPATAEGWMANYEFNRVPVDTEELRAAIERSAFCEAKRPPDFIERLNERYAIVGSHSGIVDTRPALGGLYRLMSMDHFARFEAGETVEVGERKVAAARAWASDSRARRFEMMDMHMPGREPAGVLNLFHGLPATSARPSVHSGAGDAAPILDYIHAVLASGRADVSEYLLNWAAWKVQNPLRKPGVNLFLIGGQGTGKSTFTKMMADVFGPNHSVVVSQEKHMMGNFNAHLEHKLFLGLDEAFYGKDPRAAGIYKNLTTEETLLIEPKGVDPYTAPNRFAIVVTSNSPRGVPIEPNDRRTTVVKVSDARANDSAYFEQLWSCWDTGGREAFINLLLTRNLSQFNQRMPLSTPEKLLAAAATGDLITRWWQDMVENGTLPWSTGGKGPDWHSSAVFIPNSALIDSFREFAIRAGERQHLPTQAELSARLDVLCPDRRDTRVKVDSIYRRGAIYPKLNECLAALERALTSGS